MILSSIIQTCSWNLRISDLFPDDIVIGFSISLTQEQNTFRRIRRRINVHKYYTVHGCSTAIPSRLLRIYFLM